MAGTPQSKIPGNHARPGAGGLSEPRKLKTRGNAVKRFGGTPDGIMSILQAPHEGGGAAGRPGGDLRKENTKGGGVGRGVFSAGGSMVLLKKKRVEWGGKR